MSDHIRFTVSKDSDGSFSAFSRKSGKHFEADDKGALWTTMRQKLGADRHWIRKGQWVVRCGGAVTGTGDAD
jgi:hypothetical protein